MGEYMVKLHSHWHTVNINCRMCWATLWGWLLQKLKHSIVQESQDQLTNEVEKVLPVEDVPMIVSVQSKIHRDFVGSPYTSVHAHCQSTAQLSFNNRKVIFFPQTVCKTTLLFLAYLPAILHSLLDLTQFLKLDFHFHDKKSKQVKYTLPNCVLIFNMTINTRTYFYRLI